MTRDKNNVDIVILYKHTYRLIMGNVISIDILSIYQVMYFFYSGSEVLVPCDVNIIAVHAHNTTCIFFRNVLNLSSEAK